MHFLAVSALGLAQTSIGHAIIRRAAIPDTLSIRSIFPISEPAVGLGKRIGPSDKSMRGF
ncbi:hypothetical protein [Bradyrhizobium sp. 930_D9_N1_4]|uniref:hypothetical protein n=1 Tax=Bradyrhizobium sp. 930_D9_N1_4 TaxID=3240374 RepID=UPI003F8B569E